MVAQFGSPQKPMDSQNNRENALTLRAIWQFANAASWDKAFRLLERERETLLSGKTLVLLRLMIAEMQESGDTEQAAIWEQHLHILEDACLNGTASAREAFMTWQAETFKAIEELVNVTTRRELREVLETRQHLLLSNDALIILRGSIHTQIAEGKREMAQHFEKLLYILQLITIEGREGAIEHF